MGERDAVAARDRLGLAVECALAALLLIACVFMVYLTLLVRRLTVTIEVMSEDLAQVMATTARVAENVDRVEERMRTWYESFGVGKVAGAVDGRAEADAAARILAAYEDTLARLREAQGAMVDPGVLADLALKERQLRIIAAAGLGGIIARTRDADLCAALEAEVREMLSGFLDAGAIIEEIERPFFKGLAGQDLEFARDLKGLREILVREERGAQGGR